MDLLSGTRIVKRFGSLPVLHGVDIAIRRGEALGVPTPANRVLWAVVKLVESRPAN